jgi:hypothetical protein
MGLWNLERDAIVGEIIIPALNRAARELDLKINAAVAGLIALALPFMVQLQYLTLNETHLSIRIPPRNIPTLQIHASNCTYPAHVHCNTSIRRKLISILNSRPCPISALNRTSPSLHSSLPLPRKINREGALISTT